MEMKKAVSLLVLATIMMVATKVEPISGARLVNHQFPDPLSSILLQEIAKNSNGLNGETCRDLDQSCIPYVEGFRCCVPYDCSPYPVFNLIPPGMSFELKCVKLPIVKAA